MTSKNKMPENLIGGTTEVPIFSSNVFSINLASITEDR